MSQPTTRPATRSANPPHARLEEARQRFQFNGLDGDVLGHWIDPNHGGDVVCRLRIKGHAARLGIARVGPTGEMRETLVPLDAIAMLVSAAAEFRLRVSVTPPIDDARGKRGRR